MSQVTYEITMTVCRTLVTWGSATTLEVNNKPQVRMSLFRKFGKCFFPMHVKKTVGLVMVNYMVHRLMLIAIYLVLCLFNYSRALSTLIRLLEPP